MKRRFTLLLLLFTLAASAQRVSFDLTDTIFIHGAIHTYPVNFELDGPAGVHEMSKPHLDSLADYVRQHPGLILEIGSYTDQRGNDSSNLYLSQLRANAIESYLVQRGISPYALAAVGYGEENPLVPQMKIDAEKDKLTQENLCDQNRRTEFKILRVPGRCFTLEDSVVQEGEFQRADILYDLSKCSVRPESYPLLDSLVAFMIAHPEIVIEIGNHSDSRGSDKYNTRLTECRSKDVAFYLVNHGIDSSRVQWKGYGETQLIVAESYINGVQSKQGKEELHQINRRTEIRIIKSEH